jgi:hypothetical protein
MKYMNKLIQQPAGSVIGVHCRKAQINGQKDPVSGFYGDWLAVAHAAFGAQRSHFPIRCERLNFANDLSFAFIYVKRGFPGTPYLACFSSVGPVEL